MKDLKRLQQLVEDLNTTNSTNDKKDILKNYPECKELLHYTYSPYRQYYITSENLKKRSDLVKASNCKTIIELLHKLQAREITGHDAIATVNGFICENQEHRIIIYRIIDRDLQIRIAAKVINDVFPGCVPEFTVALAQKYDDYEDKVNFEKDIWYASRKMDGVRCIAIVENGSVQLFSRKGKEFTTLDNLKEELKKFKCNFVFDGEICLVDEKGNENFQDIMKEIRRKDHTIPAKNLRYKVFDVLTQDEFFAAESQVTLTKRLLRWTYKSNVVQLLDQIVINDKAHLIAMTNEAVKAGWEGLIIRKDAAYEGKRTKAMLKVKKFHDAEYKVLDVELGLIDNGKGKKVPGLSSLVIHHKGSQVNVGTGLSYEERIRFHNNPKEIIGKIITVSYFEETVDEKGKPSLRFPVLKVIHGNKREV